MFGIFKSRPTTRPPSTEECLASAKRHIDNCVTLHLDALAIKLQQTVSVDDYGHPETERWKKELTYFFANIIRPGLSDSDIAAMSSTRFNYGQHITDRVGAEVERRKSAEPRFDEVAEMSPVDYEHFCSDLITRRGWECKVTKASGDQGVDVIAKKDGRTLVVQCKKYSAPVGNKAVQEVIAAKAHVRATFAAVVSNASFTASAKELASSTGVKLLHHTDLEHLDEKLGAL